MNEDPTQNAVLTPEEMVAAYQEKWAEAADQVTAAGGMHPFHPRWEEFLENLGGPRACNFHEKTPGDPTSVAWTCKGGQDKTFAVAILADMGFDTEQVAASCRYFESLGGHCDCEIVFNCEQKTRHEQQDDS